MNKNIFLTLAIFLAFGPTILCMEEMEETEPYLPILLEEKSAEEQKIADNALFWAVDNGIQEIVEYLVDHGENVNLQKESDGQTPLMLASLNGHKDIVEFLLRKNANPNLQDSEGETAIVYAALNRHLDIMERLSEITNLDLIDKAGNTQKDAAIMYARAARARNTM